MAESLFNRLEKVPVSKKKQRFAVKFGRPGASDDMPRKAKVTVSRKIDSSFNRNAIMKKLKRRVKLNTKPPLLELRYIKFLSDNYYADYTPLDNV